MLPTMPTAHVPTAHDQTKRIAIIYVGALVALNAVFYVMSGSYFDSHREIVGGMSVSSYTPEQMAHVRMTFVVFSGVVAALGFAAGMWPRAVGHVLPVLLGIVHLMAGGSAWLAELRVLGITLVLSGLLMPVLAWSSYRDRSRAAWAFLLVICAVFGVGELFGISKVRDALGVGLWTAMILPGANAVVVAALGSLRGEYIERGSATA
jgi:hypothetical protein